MAAREQTRNIRTLCPLCPNHDGLVATVENGRVTNLTGVVLFTTIVVVVSGSQW